MYRKPCTQITGCVSWLVFRIIPRDIIWGFISWNHGGLTGWFPPSCRPRVPPRQIHPRGRQRRTPLNPLGHVYISAAAPYIRLQFLLLPSLPDPGATMPRDLPCPSRNLTGPGSPEASSENITLSDERWRKMKGFVDIDGIYAHSDDP